ncbi:MAG: hypothetical protein AB7L92_00435 [Alphaproteobacteria bacterium]
MLEPSKTLEYPNLEQYQEQQHQTEFIKGIGRQAAAPLDKATMDNMPLFIQTTETQSLGDNIGGLLGLSFLANFNFNMNRGVLKRKPLQ